MRSDASAHTEAATETLATILPNAVKRDAKRAFGALATIMKDNLYVLRGDRHIYTSPWVNEGPLRRCSASIGISALRKPFEISIGGTRQFCQAGAIRPMIERELHAENVGIVGFQFDPAHPDFPRFRRLPAPGLLLLDRNLFRRFDQALEAVYRGVLTAGEASDLFDRVTAVAFAHFPQARPIDRRVQRVIELLRGERQFPLTELAAAVGLSYHHLSHLFAKELGIPFRSYQLWRKVKKATSLAEGSGSLAKIAKEAGFADPAHFCKAFRQLYGAPPSSFFRSGNVRIIAPATERKKKA